MGWECRDIEVKVCLRLDSHGGDKEREDEEKAEKLESELMEAVRGIVSKREYEGIVYLTFPYGLEGE